MKDFILEWKKFVENTDLDEGGAMQLIGGYKIQYITEDMEAIVALQEVLRWVSKNNSYDYPVREYSSLENVLNESIDMLKSVIETKKTERLGYLGSKEGGEAQNSLFEEGEIEEGSAKKTSRFREGDKVKHKEENNGVGTVVSRIGNNVGVRWPSGQKTHDHNMLTKV